MNIIVEELEKMKKHLQKQIDCNHKFKEHGFGFKCRKCKLYTGMNDKWNEYVRENYVV